MTMTVAAACFVLIAAVMYFVGYKLKETAKRKAFHFDNRA
jgi:hypothetical protein